MTALHYSALCHGTGREPCDWIHDGPDSDLAARKHTDATGHVTTTCLAGGPMARVGEGT